MSALTTVPSHVLHNIKTEAVDIVFILEESWSEIRVINRNGVKPIKESL